MIGPANKKRYTIAGKNASHEHLAASIAANKIDAGTKKRRKVNTLKSVGSLSLFTQQSVKIETGKSVTETHLKVLISYLSKCYWDTFQSVKIYLTLLKVKN